MTEGQREIFVELCTPFGSEGDDSIEILQELWISRLCILLHQYFKLSVTIGK